MMTTNYNSGGGRITLSNCSLKSGIFIYNLMLFDRVIGNKMTSETSDKTPLIVSTAVIGNIGRHKPLIGVFFVLLSWLYIYFQVIWSLYEGILDFSDTSGARSKTIDKYGN